MQAIIGTFRTEFNHKLVSHLKEPNPQTEQMSLLTTELVESATFFTSKETNTGR